MVRVNVVSVRVDVVAVRVNVVAGCVDVVAIFVDVVAVDFKVFVGTWLYFFSYQHILPFLLVCDTGMVRFFFITMNYGVGFIFMSKLPIEGIFKNKFWELS